MHIDGTSVPAPDAGAIGVPQHVPSVHTRVTDPSQAVAEVRARLADADLALVLFFCSSRFDLEQLGSAFSAAYGRTPVVGCTTAGEIGPAGYHDGSLVAVGLPAADFVVASTFIGDLDAFDEAQAREMAADMLGHVGGTPNDCFSLLLVDGLSFREERVVRQCQRALGDVPLVGGSAGDDQSFVATHVFHDGRFRRGAVWLVARTALPFSVFRSSHFTGDSEALVVTEADAAHRLVLEINGRPAAVEYARVLGLSREELTLGRAAAAPLVVRIGGNDYVRSIQRLEPDDSIRLYCAIDRGVVLRVAQGMDMVDSRRDLFDDVRRKIGTPVLTLGFDCIQCKQEAEDLDGKQSVEKVFVDNAVVGFSSYGEQFLGVHVNQTFTGVVIGEPR
jgi:hypothetical protein